jgi:voltage-gated potassium channel
LWGNLSIFAGILVFGTVGYCWLEGWPWFDALYMTVISLTTVGYGETHPLSPQGRFFTVLLLGTGVAGVSRVTAQFLETLNQGYWHQLLRQQRMDSYQQHYILCGFGRTGRQVALEFRAESIPFLVVDLSPEAIATAETMGCAVYQGDATEDGVLLAVGVERAAGIIAALASDADNLYVVLSAKTLNPQLRAIARASSQEAIQKMRRAGADEVISPYITGGKRMAAAAIRPQVLDFMDGILTGGNRSFYIEEFLLEAPNPHINATLKDARLRSQTGALVLAVRRSHGELLAGPSGDTLLCAGDVLICMGTAEELRSLNRILCPQRPRGWLRLPRQT